MNNILDYLDWRGDLPLSISPFNEIDSLILCQLSYINFEGIVPSDFRQPITVREMATLFSTSQDYEIRTEIGPLINKNSFPLLEKVGKSVRFGNMRVCGYTAQLDLAKEKQFSAITFLLGDKTIYIAFRGTDATIVGWKEDFNMAFMSPVPAQQDAITYLERVADNLRGDIRVGGHSKGGNLAIYSSAFCNKKVQKRIFEVYNNDGPGFETKVMKEPSFIAVTPFFKSYIPKSSVIGMLFEHEDGYTIVESNEQNGIMQHDPFSWSVKATAFETRNELTADSIFLDSTVKDWLQQMSKEQRIQFIDTLFSLLEANNAKSLSDLTDNWTKNAGAVIKALTEIDPETREAVWGLLRLFFKSAKKNMPSLSDYLTFKRTKN